jgi:hypothetical protein
MFYRNLTYIVEIFSKSLSFGNIIYLDRNEKKKKCLMLRISSVDLLLLFFKYKLSRFVLLLGLEHSQSVRYNFSIIPPQNRSIFLDLLWKRLLGGMKDIRIINLAGMSGIHLAMCRILEQ